VKDELKITGAGIYAFMPWTKTDRLKKTVVKIGESGDLAWRAEDYSTYFPNGVYMLGLITDIKTPPGTRANPRKPARRIREDMEQFIMDYVHKMAVKDCTPVREFGVQIATRSKARRSGSIPRSNCCISVYSVRREISRGNAHVLPRRLESRYGED
jgi:hypothetical protein